MYVIFSLYNLKLCLYVRNRNKNELRIKKNNETLPVALFDMSTFYLYYRCRIENQSIELPMAFKCHTIFFMSKIHARAVCNILNLIISVCFRDFFRYSIQ